MTGGASQLPGLVEMASAVLDKQVRHGRPLQNLGLPKSMSGPAFSGCAGLIAYAHLEKSEQVLSHSFAQENNSLTGRMTSWLRQNI